MSARPEPVEHVYEAGAPRPGAFAALARMASNLWISRELIAQIVRRDFVVPYKRSYVGFAWMLVAPLAAVASWVFLNAAGLLRAGDTGVPYPVYVLVGTTVWGLLVASYAATAGTLESGSGLVLQVKFPHEVLFAKQLAPLAANFLIAMGVNLAVLACFGMIPGPAVVLFPLALIPLLLFGTGLGLAACIFNVFWTDVHRGLSLALGLLVFATPVIYAPESAAPWMQRVIAWNPLSYLVAAPRDLVIYGAVSDMPAFGVSSALALLVFLSGLRLFAVAERRVVEMMP